MNGVAMAIYTIDDDNIITMHSAAPAGGPTGVRFDNAKELAKATAHWPVSRLAEVWNNLPIEGLRPVKKFMDRKTAVARIWAVIQNLTPIPTPDAAICARPVAKTRKRRQMDSGAHGVREGSKKSIVLAMLRDPKGAALCQIQEATGWQRHTIRGFISGAVSKQLGLKVESTRTETGERRYRILA